MASIFFPLRTSVELFKDPGSPEAVTRVKEAAVLFDEVILETGLYTVTVGDNGSFPFWTPPHQVTPDMLEHSREVVEPGTPWGVSVQLQSGRGGEPVGEPRALISGTVDVQFAAEFRTGILDELEQFSDDEVDWVRTIPGGGLVPGHPITEAVRQLDTSCRFAGSSLLPDETNPFRKSLIFQSFNRDSVVGSHLGTAFNITSLFRPMVERGGVTAYHAGAEALNLVVPNLSALPWEAVVQFRQHDGSREARSKLAEFEQRAASEEPEDAQDYLRRVAQEVIAGTTAAWDELRPSLPEELGKEAVKTGVALIPFIGPFIEKGATGAEIIADALADRRHWLAALMELRDRK